MRFASICVEFPPLFGWWFWGICVEFPPLFGWWFCGNLFGGSAAAGLYALGPEVNNAAFPWFLVVLALVGILAMLVCRAGWPSLFRLTFTYGLLARVPIVILTYILCFEAAGTHYEKVAPMAPTDLTTLARATWLSVAQIGVWVPLTVLFGGLAGALTAFIIPRKQV